MFDYRIREIAAPDARIAELTLSGKTISTPTHFATLTRQSEPDRIANTFQRLNEEGEPLLPHTGGFVVESQNVSEILESDQDHTQAVLGGNNFTDFKTLVDDIDRILVVEPNTDRLLYWNYRQKIDSLTDHLPPEFQEAARRLDLDEEDSEHLKLEEAYPLLRKSVSQQEFVEGIVQLQIDNDADIVLPPYFPIGAEDYEDTLETNISLFNLAQEATDMPVAPVIPLKTSVLGMDGENENGRIHGAQEWIDIIQSYRELDPHLLFIKATNSRIDPNTLDKTESEGTYNFFSLLRRFTNIPAFFLGIDEFAYILMQDGLDGYSHPLYDTPYRAPVTNGEDANNHSPHRKFIVPRGWGWEKFDQLDSLGCNCPFCEEFSDVDPADIELSDQDDLRNSHWLWLKDEELEEISEAIQNDELRPGLKSICNDSEWKKNLATFL